MLESLKRLLHPRKKLDDAVSAEVAKARTLTTEEKYGALQQLPSAPGYGDPLTSRGHKVAPLFGEEGTAATVKDFPTESTPTVGGRMVVGDSRVYTADGAVSGSGGKPAWSAYGVPEALQMWYASHSFIGHQTCAIMAQHWLVDKACTMPGEDATRNGYQVTVSSDAAVDQMDPDTANEYVAKLQDLDNDYGVTEQLIQFWRFTQVFGIRVALFDIKSDDPQYYEKPFNIDGVTRDSYKGIRQVDPNWMMPVLTNEESSDPTSPNFYDPSFWIIAGKKYHRSHLIIGRGPEPADILKPSYIFGGIPLVQRIYERVYASERTANEGPMLAMTKRTTVLKTNLALAEAQPERFLSRILKWAEYRDNYGVKTVNTDDNVEQHDTGLADLDVTIMTQYQLVAAIAKVPSAKLMGTSPKGFNATGDHETKSYHEHLESVQKFLSPLLTRHHELLARSQWGVELPVKHTWNRVDSFTAKELAELNHMKAQTGEILVTTVAAISSDEERNRLKNDPLSGYGHLGDVEAETEIGVTPETEQGAAEAEAKLTTAGAKAEQVQSPDQPRIGMESANDETETIAELVSIIRGMNGEYDDRTVTDVLSKIEAALSGAGGDNLAQIVPMVEEVVAILKAAAGASGRAVVPSTRPGVTSESLNKAQGARRVQDGNQIGLPDKGGKDWSHKAFKQHKAGRYTVSIENPKGSIRSGVTLAGEHWRSQMPYDYGYINGTKGADGDEVDVFIGPKSFDGGIYIVNQIEPTTGKFDEHKVMMGFASKLDAIKAYDDAYQKGWTGRDSTWEVTPAQFREWLAEDDLTKPYRDLYAD